MAKSMTKKMLDLRPGEKIVITGGDTSGKSGTTSLLKVEEI
jgi:ABC-type transport system involved in cytochrome bd biosynthesis fused ATPase/permease subunit